VTFVNELNLQPYSRYMMTESSPLLQRLRQIPYGPGLFSIPRTPSNALRGVETASKGFLLDLFSLAAAKHPSEEGWDIKQTQSIEANATSSIICRTIVDLAERTQYPGPDTLNLGQGPYSDFMLPTLAGPLEDMKASLLVGRKFKLILTTDPSEHLTMSAAGEIKLFWEGPCEVPDFPGRKTFMRYRHHSLRKMLGASTVYDELVLTYSFLFTRDASSKKIATELFAGHDMTVVFVSGNSHRVDPPRWSVMITEWDFHFPKQQAPLLQHFERYRGHLASLLNEMAERKGQPPNFPPAPFQMRGYKDRFTLYVILFAVLIGVVSITSIMQTILSFRAYAYGAGIG